MTVAGHSELLYDCWPESKCDDWLIFFRMPWRWSCLIKCSVRVLYCRIFLTDICGIIPTNILLLVPLLND